MNQRRSTRAATCSGHEENKRSALDSSSTTDRLSHPSVTATATAVGADSGSIHNRSGGSVTSNANKGSSSESLCLSSAAIQELRHHHLHHHHHHFSPSTFTPFRSDSGPWSTAAAAAAAAAAAVAAASTNPANMIPNAGHFFSPMVYHGGHHYPATSFPGDGGVDYRTPGTIGVTSIGGGNTVSNVEKGAGSDSNTSTASSTGQPKKTRRRIASAAQRRAANIRERRRMFNLNSAFDRLRKRVPTFAYEKRLSRIDTLRLAMTYIRFMTELLESTSGPNSTSTSSSTSTSIPIAGAGHNNGTAHHHHHFLHHHLTDGPGSQVVFASQIQ